MLRIKFSATKCSHARNWSGRRTMNSWAEDTIFGIHAVIYSTRIKLRELLELAT